MTNFPSEIDHSHIPDSPCRNQANIDRLCDLFRRRVDLNPAALHDMQEDCSRGCESIVEVERQKGLSKQDRWIDLL